MLTNPFAVTSPEEMKAEKANELFVELYNTDFPQITRPGNIIMTGSRGCGKSMLIRCSLPDVIMLKKEGCRASDLEYLAFHVPVKKTSLPLTELRLLDNRHAPYLINEHFMSLYVLMYSLLGLSEISFDEYSEDLYRNFFENTYKRYLFFSGCEDDIDVNFASSEDFFISLYRHTEKMQADFIKYIIGLDPNTNKINTTYELPLLSFLRFIVPVFKELVNLPGFPSQKNIYLFIDDADNLSTTQTEILNTWISCRTQPTISIKISAQYELYKSFLTTNGILIESPHDYQSINISLRYTTDYKANYKDKAIEILNRRLKSIGIDTPVEQFFPTYQSQEDGIRQEMESLKNNYSTSGRGNRLDDDVRRYAVPNYIKNLGGNRKSRSTYRYAGLNNMIHLSSGIIRNLLDSAARMFDIVSGTLDDKTVDIIEIPTDIQNDVLRQLSDEFLYTEFRKPTLESIESYETLEPIENPNGDVEKLQNLVHAMGQTFHEILVSERSERKVFSIALSNIPTSEIKRVLKTGVRLGFFHEATIGNKDGNGRTLLFILNRRLAPSFVLDPTGFQGYLFMTNDDIHKAMTSGKQLRKISDESNDDIRQLSFDDVLEG